MSAVSAAIIIPARYASTRLPGKPLLRQTGKYLLQHVYERACQARRAGGVYVATDDLRIVRAVEEFGGLVFLTREDHVSGTDRVAEAATWLDAEILVNLQGDEPLIDPKALDQVIEQLQRDPNADMATLACPITSATAYHSPHCVKVVRDDLGRAMYFSRAPIPFVRDGNFDWSRVSSQPHQYQFLQHVGLYGYRREFLFRLAATPPHPLEQAEKLEQLRALALGCRMPVGLIDEPTLGVDTPEDYDHFVALYRQAQRQAA